MKQVRSTQCCMLWAILWISVLCVAAQSNESENPVRTRSEIEALIDQKGRQQPEWWDSVTFDYPPALDLTWPNNPPPPWNPRKNVGQYIWDIINPNPGRWQGGVKFLHHLLTVNKDNPATVAKIMDGIGRMYHDLLEDWARAAFWWEKAAGMGARRNSLGLAHCYWKLGNKEMAVEILKRTGGDYTRHGAVIKLWADMGEFDTAIELAESKARFGPKDTAYLAAGDACRRAGRYQQALAYYARVLKVPDREREGDLKKNRERAQASMEAIRLFDALDLSRVPDGTYQGNSIAYAGQLHVKVTVKDGRIKAVDVTKHREKQFYSAITDTTKQILWKQNVKDIDATTGATITSEAIINATAKAIANASR